MQEKQKAELVSALHWTSPVEPNLEATERNIIIGWNFDPHTKKVFQAWSSIYSHGTGVKPGINVVSRNAIKLFSNEVLALKALRYVIETLTAKELLEIDQKIIFAAKEMQEYEQKFAPVANQNQYCQTNNNN